MQPMGAIADGVALGLYSSCGGHQFSFTTGGSLQHVGSKKCVNTKSGVCQNFTFNGFFLKFISARGNGSFLSHAPVRGSTRDFHALSCCIQTLVYGPKLKTNNNNNNNNNNNYDDFLFKRDEDLRFAACGVAFIYINE